MPSIKKGLKPYKNLIKKYYANAVPGYDLWLMKLI